MSKAKLIIDSPAKNASLIYAAGYYCVDPIILLDLGQEKMAWFPATEFEKAKKKSTVNHVFNLSTHIVRLNQSKKYPSLKSSILIDFLKQNKIADLLVPDSFPILEAENLKKYGFMLYPIQEPFYRERVSKTEKEIDKIRQNSLKNVQVMAEVKDLIGASSITHKQQLKYQGELLTSEYLQTYILKSLIDKNMIADNVIVAIGNQGCDPHEYGYGIIAAHTSIIVDIFPRGRDNYYYSDMTRTFCKGKASSELKKIYSTVLEAQKLGLDLVKAGQDGQLIHQKILALFRNKGYKSGSINGILQGFFHGTGHGLGLDCHEEPTISNNSYILEKNSIVSVEPGLYYIDRGAVRIEDLVVVTENSCENLTDYEKKLEIE